MDRRPVKLLVIHCADTPNGKHFDAANIDQWHQEREFERKRIYRDYFNPQFSAIGYHYVILLDGTVQTGRHPDEVGAHAVGYNLHSIGICMIGKDAYTQAQWDSLRNLVDKLDTQYNGPDIKGHRQLTNVSKTCPGFDVTAWLNGGKRAIDGHVLG